VDPRADWSDQPRYVDPADGGYVEDYEEDVVWQQAGDRELADDDDDWGEEEYGYDDYDDYEEPPNRRGRYDDWS